MYLSPLVGVLDGVRVLDDSKAVLVVHLSFGLVLDLGQLRPVAEVEALDVALHIGAQRLPVVGPLAHGLPAVVRRIGDVLPMLRSQVHQLLGDAAHIDAGSSQAPRGA
eukprot:scaffold213_cov245-Pinguiococcus_pyrenoidosus.AAC.51